MKKEKCSVIMVGQRVKLNLTLKLATLQKDEIVDLLIKAYKKESGSWCEDFSDSQVLAEIATEVAYDSINEMLSLR